MNSEALWLPTKAQCVPATGGGPGTRVLSARVVGLVMKGVRLVGRALFGAGALLGALSACGSNGRPASLVSAGGQSSVGGHSGQGGRAGEAGEASDPAGMAGAAEGGGAGGGD